MNCYECAKEGNDVAAVGICHHCGAGLCLEHARQAAEYTVGGTHYGCPHDFQVTARAGRGMTVGVARSNEPRRLPVGSAR